MGAVRPDHPWVPPKPRRSTADPGSRTDTAIALRLLDQSARAWKHNPDLSGQLTSQAVGLIGPEAVLTIFRLQAAGKIPEPGTPGWQHLLELADTGDIEIATVILIRDRDYVCEDQVAERFRPPPTVNTPISLRDELRQMGMLE